MAKTPHEKHHLGGHRETVTRDVGGAGIAGSPGVSEGGPLDRETTREEEREAIEHAYGEASGLRGDLGDTPPGED